MNDLAAALRQLRRDGYATTRTTRGHWQVRRGSQLVATAPGTPSDWRSVRNLRAVVRRDQAPAVPAPAAAPRTKRRPSRRESNPATPAVPANWRPSLAPRQAVAYACERGCEFSVPLAAEITPPPAWECRCGKRAILAQTEGRRR